MTLQGYLDECAAVLRAAGFDCFVPHENLLSSEPVAPARIFTTDHAALKESNAVVAILDGPTVDDGTACEIGLFRGLMEHDPHKKGILGVRSDIRSTRLGDVEVESGLNPFLAGYVLSAGEIHGTIEECIPRLQEWARGV